MKIKNSKLLILSLFITSIFFSFNFVKADAIQDIMFINDNGNIIYINPTNLEQKTINTIEDLKNILINKTEKTKDVVKEIAPFSDETQKPTNLTNADEMNVLLNKQRSENNIKVLTVSSILTKTAEERCLNMVDTDNTADRSSSKIISSIKSNGGSVTLATEVLYWGSTSSYSKAVDWWMNEPKYHRSNILKSAFKYFGSAICKNSSNKNYFVTVFSN